MKILALSLRGPTNGSNKGGGATQALWEVGRRWVKLGHRVCVLSAFESSNPDLVPFESVDGIEVTRLGNLFTAPFGFSRWFHDTRPEADVIVENMQSYPLMGPLYAHFPYVSIIHGLVRAAYFETAPFVLASLGYISERVLPYVYGKTHFAAVSELNRQDLIDLGIPSRLISVIPCGVDHAMLTPGVQANDPTILFLGLMGDRRKRVGDLIEAFKIVLQAIPNARLVLAGEGKFKEIYRAQAVGIERVVFKDYVWGDEKRRLLQAAWVFCMPSVRETFSIASMEANACGAPVVAYETPGLDTIRHEFNGLLVPPHDIPGLTRALIRLLSNTDERREMATRGVRHTQQFHWDRMASDLLVLCDSAQEVWPAHS